MGEIEKKLNTNTSINKNIDKHIILKFLGTAVMGILESYVLNEIDSDVEYVATQVGELMRREYINNTAAIPLRRIHKISLSKTHLCNYA